MALADVFSPLKRSEIMSKIKGKNSECEIYIRKLIWKNGFRYRLHCTDIPGRPDLVFRRSKKAIFVNGCFWHGHDCMKSKIPKTNSSFWMNKISKNMMHDQLVYSKLLANGWTYMVIWQCNITKKNTLQLEKDIISFLAYLK